MPNRPLTLFEVLVEEYNSQEVKPTLAAKDINEMEERATRLTPVMDDECERQKKFDDEMVQQFYDWLNKQGQVRRAALCLSGGGIRSGTFALGLLQGLARHNLLDKFHYLSTVSGGGYIGSWLTAWINRHPKGLEGVTTELANSKPASRIDPDPDPLRYLRQYSSFITPETGILSADTWSFVGIYLRNLSLNWLVIFPLIFSMLTIPRIFLALTLEPSGKPLLANPFGKVELSIYGRHVFLAIGFALGSWALAYIVFNRPGARGELQQGNSVWRDRGDQKNFLIFCLLPLVLSAVCLTTYWAWSSRAASQSVKPVYIFLLFGVAFTLLSWLIACFILRRSLAKFFQPELVALLLAGVAGGFLFWVVSQQSIGSPIVAYGKPFPWSYWSTDSHWTWLTWTTELYACLGVPIYLVAFLLAATVFVGASSRNIRIQDDDREWWARLGAWVIIVIFAWTIANALVIFGPIALLSSPKLLTSMGGVSGLIAVLAGRSAKTSGKPDGKDQTSAGMVGSLLTQSLTLLAAIFIATLIAAFSLATSGIIQRLAQLSANLTTSDWGDWLSKTIPIKQASWADWLTQIPAVHGGFHKYLDYIYPGVGTQLDAFTGAKIVHMNVLHHTSLWLLLGLGGLTLLVGVIASRTINLNLFSLHAGYRNRLIRAFLGASRPANERLPNPFTGFDPADNFQMHEMHPALLTENDFTNSVALAQELLNGTKDLSRYLSGNNLLTNLKALPSTTADSPRLVAALRKDLNSALEDEMLPKKVRGLIVGSEASPNLANRLRDQEYIVRNRELLQQTYPGLIAEDISAEPPRMMHVINTTLNLVGGKNLAWQQRKAEPFSISPLHSGCFRLGYRDSREYGGPDGISIGTAAATSGAAASSNMGYYTTSPVLSMLLTFFNVRLGWWLGNPGVAGNETYTLPAPLYSFKPVLDEAFGLTDDQNKYVYLTDGGHFENLGIYEMVLRRCRIIIASDAAEDREYHFSDLGNAVRKIRIDLGVPIEFESIPISALPPASGKGMYWALGRIRYSCIDPGAEDGVLLYFKPAVYGEEPRDVLEYKESFPDFPHQSTADQFFDEPQFESYRMLGSFVMDQLCGEGTEPLTLDDVLDRAFKKSGSGASIKKPVTSCFW